MSVILQFNLIFNIYPLNKIRYISENMSYTSSLWNKGFYASNNFILCMGGIATEINIGVHYISPKVS